jgi:hypothetical protein
LINFPLQKFELAIRRYSDLCQELQDGWHVTAPVTAGIHCLKELVHEKGINITECTILANRTL